MLAKARTTLASLRTAGTRATADHSAFEKIICALILDNAREGHMLGTIQQLLGINLPTIHRALNRSDAISEDTERGAFSRATAIKRKRRKDYLERGRAVAAEYWHKATRLDTNVGKKKRGRRENELGKVFYIEHWRHVQYDTDEQIAADFFVSVDYKHYTDTGGTAFGKDIFLQCKCFCIEKSTFSECACPSCTLMREGVRYWNKQRPRWFSEADKSAAAATAASAEKVCWCSPRALAFCIPARAQHTPLTPE